MTLQKKRVHDYCFMIIPLTLGDLPVAKNYQKRSVSIQQEDPNIVTEDKSELV